MLGITGTGGSGKSSLTDELVRRLRVDQEDKLRVAVIAVDPTRRKGGGALLGDRIRMNSLDGDRVFFRSLATRGAHEIPPYLTDVITVLKAAGFDLVVIETPGIGQGDAAIVPFVDTSLYVMTPEFGAASQLEKIDMLDFADAVAINKFERRGAEDALRDVGRQLVRNREAFGKQPSDMPVFGTSAATFNDDGVTALYQHLRGLLAEHGLPVGVGHARPGRRAPLDGTAQIVPPERVRYLSEIAETVRGYHADDRARSPSRRPGCSGCSWCSTSWPTSSASGGPRRSARAARRRARGPPRRGRASSSRSGRRSWRPTPATSWSSWSATRRSTRVGPRVAVRQQDPPGRAAAVHRPRRAGALLASRRTCRASSRSPPGCSRSSATARTRPGCSPARATRSVPTAASSCSREGNPATRLSTAFDSVTLYGRDPDPRPDIYGKVGTSGVSVATLDDMKALYDGFDLVSPTTSVSMTINGPAPTILAFFLNTAIDQQVDRFRTERRAASPTSRSARSSRRTPSRTSAAPCRPTSSRRTRARTPASSPPSSACG